MFTYCKQTCSRGESWSRLWATDLYI